MRNNIKLLLKLIIPYSLFIIISSAIIFVLFIRVYKSDYIEQISINIDKIGYYIERDIDNVNLVLNILDSYAVADLTPYEIGLSMSNVYNKRQEFFDILYGDTIPFSEGGLFLSVTHQYPTNYDQTSRVWYKGALTTNGIYITDPYIDFNTKKLLITFSKAVYTNGRLKGVIGIDFSSVSNVRTEGNIDKNNIFLITSDGTYIKHSNPDYVLKEGVNIFNTDKLFEGTEEYVNNTASPIKIKNNNWYSVRKIPNTNLALAVKGSLDDYKSIFNKTIFIFLGIVIFLLVMGIFLTAIVLLPLSRYLDMAITAIDNMANGNFSYRIDKGILSKHNRAGDLARAIDKMEANIGKLIFKIKKAIEDINTVGVEISQSSEKLLERDYIQAVNLEKLDEALKNIGTAINLSSISVATSKDSMEKMENTTQTGVQTINEIESNMNEIQASSKKIFEITKSIESIALQTNILALNAAVEAARAGEQGRGFAVVASEIRKLATTVSQATKDITVIVENAVTKIDNGSTSVSRTSITLEHIAKSSVETSSILLDISSSSNEEIERINNINNDIGVINEIMIKNEELSKDASDASAKTSKMAEDIVKELSFFKFGHSK
ncbi:methyl-accepting chemotaxis protein [Brachyspira hyodysenteriae]|uniref:methyl-accepting chemotaxis protein n=1 Tax=Brachyspira hyodysenteriae TaxID=159 RepID=UPI0022CD82E0|nr:methyl-accepting chemotaxis protein [Brachyspira hyodysenteriae]MCZ9849724.1 methyl-accepting chemotaxis protein [Brachyspira hyodysenteriae]MCZ9861453.1 methyl-accepting chemotaxis protein [Brachyspira hyodysenteriae]MCZ9892847.1 methyl-accepting chemotaxis protein [Brachyspira hyodysenteriae]MCZ9896115.1 methyl-accepting chemotaxis protein [Brachyspira hyodysenteriae]MCZ9918024.1 methyl-accepting chemotaxis protein [Brachyspira hyodysenteriae]